MFEKKNSPQAPGSVSLSDGEFSSFELTPESVESSDTIPFIMSLSGIGSSVGSGALPHGFLFTEKRCLAGDIKSYGLPNNWGF